MAKTNFRNVAEYLAAQPENVRISLERVRSAIQKALPRAEEVISYKIPAYKLNNRIVLYFAGWKSHYSLYPAGETLLAAFKDQLSPYQVTKGTIRFPLSEPVPVKLISRIAEFRAKEMRGRSSNDVSSKGNR